MNNDATQPLLFINYRIVDTSSVAARLEADLRNQLAVGTIFRDQSSMPAGSDWPDELQNAIESAQVVLVLIGKQWLRVYDEHGANRLDLNGDWVRAEIATALANNATVIPIRVDDAKEISSAALENRQDILPLSKKQCLPLRSNKEWNYDLNNLINNLEVHGFVRKDKNATSEHKPRFASNVPSRESGPFVGRELEVKEMNRRLDASEERCVLVLKGESGVGKSGLSREFARQHQQRYPEGTLFVDARTSGAPADLARLGRSLFGLAFPDGIDLEEQCFQTLQTLGSKRMLIIYDNVLEPDDIRPWLPGHHAICDVLITTTWEDWDARWQVLEILPLPSEAALELVAELSGDKALADTYGPRIVESAGGLPVQLCPTAAALVKAARRNTLAEFETELRDETRKSFNVPWNRLDESAQLTLFAALTFSPSSIDRSALTEVVEHSLDNRATAIKAVDACLDSYMLQSGTELSIHDLKAAFVQEQISACSTRNMLTSLAQKRFDSFHETAKRVDKNPADRQAISSLLNYQLVPSLWQSLVGETVLDGENLHSAGGGLKESGLFAEARLWYERAVKEKEQGDVHGRIDHESLGSSLHQVGYCYSQTVDYESARPWYERAVAEKEQGDVHGRVDHASLGRSLHMIGNCYSETGDYASARPWYERAVSEKEQGDVRGRVDHASLGSSLHVIGYCYSQTGDYASARPWYERAVSEKKQGDVHGRVDHESLGSSLHLIGYCYSQTGDYASARPWYERAVSEKEQGDVHGRVDHASLGRSLRQVGGCYSETGDYESARPRYERAVEEQEQGDVHGRVDHESLGSSLHQVGVCYSETGDYESARPWYERAVSEKEQGDVHGVLITRVLA